VTIRDWLQSKTERNLYSRVWPKCSIFEEPSFLCRQCEVPSGAFEFLLLTSLLRNCGSSRYEFQMNMNVEVLTDNGVEARRSWIIFLANTSRSLRKR
jgi:hypothetical protein